jgi:alginate O-acetyltransferase complex protein AlgI
MLFSSTVFIFMFLPFVLFVYYILLRKKRDLQNMFLLIASLTFYAWGEPWFVFIMIISILVNWYFGLLVDKYRDIKTKARLIITVMIIFNLAVIFVFKYLMFTLKNINFLFNASISIPNIILPIGISFFTFQAISYVIDVYRKQGEAQKKPLNVGLYISFFPQLIAGPIVRYETIADQILNRKESFEDFSEGVTRFICGLGKKVLLANTLAIVADKAFSLPANELSVAFAWLGAMAYTFQIYFDFSGYSDMAIGLGKMFGFHFLENFNHPYISKSISEFWRRWHISLGSCFRDYLYFPLGGSRVSTKSRLIFNLFVVWFCTGLWHGANYTFIAWGLLYFIFITIEKITGFEKKFTKLNVLKHLYTLLLVILGWVIFRADTMTEAMGFIRTMFGLSGNLIFDSTAYYYFTENIYFYLFAIIFSMPAGNWIIGRLHRSKLIAAIQPAVFIGIFLIAVSYIVKGSYNPFIYFNF